MMLPTTIIGFAPTMWFSSNNVEGCAYENIGGAKVGGGGAQGRPRQSRTGEDRNIHARTVLNARELPLNSAKRKQSHSKLIMWHLTQTTIADGRETAGSYDVGLLKPRNWP